MPRTNRFRWLGVPLVALAMIAVPISAWAALEAPYDGNQTCGSFNDGWIELYKAEVNGDLSGSAAGVSWTITDGAHGQMVAWSSDEPLVAVAVKGGKIGGNLYEYSPNATSDSGLHTPVNNANGKWADVSHVSFCVEPPQPEPGLLVIHKVTEPSDDYSTFGFATWMPFLEDTWTTSLMDGESDSFEVETGWYTIVESPAPGWVLTDVTCDSRFDPTGTGVAVHVDEGETVNCTFTNTMEYVEPEPGIIVVRKATIPADAPTDFPFTMTETERSGPESFTLMDGESMSFEVDAGLYSIVESPVDGWTLASMECDGGDPGFSFEDARAMVTVDEGETVTCTYTNVADEEQEAGVIIRKVTSPPTRDVWFEFESDIPQGDGTFAPTLTGGQTGRVAVEPGIYTVNELATDGWELADVWCDDEEAIITETGVILDVDPEERVRCVFTNEQLPEPDPGTVVIHKVTDPSGSEEVFGFDTSIPDGEVLWAPSLMDGEHESIEVEAGTYLVNEIVPEGWELADVACDSEGVEIGPTGATVTVAEGETVSCTFTNELIPVPEPGTVTITKVTDPEDTEAWFQFESSIDGFAPVLMHEESASVDVEAGVYTVAEVEKAGWELMDLACDDPDTVIVDGKVTLDVAEGETVSCTFTNEPLEEPVPSGIVITKVTDPVDTEVDFVFETSVPEDSATWAPTLGHDESATIEVEPGTFTIDEVLPDGWQVQGIECDDPETVIGDLGVTLDVDGSETVSCTFTNEPIPPEPGAIGDFVWNDANANGLQDETEVGIEGVVVKLFEVKTADANTAGDADSTLVDLLMTDEEGLYIFEDVPAGFYFVEFTNLPKDFQFTEPNMGDHELDSDAIVATGRTPVMELAEGERDLDCDAGALVEKVSPKKVTPTTEAVAGDTTTTTEPVILPFTGVDTTTTGMAAIALMVVGFSLVGAAGMVRRFNN